MLPRPAKLPTGILLPLIAGVIVRTRQALALSACYADAVGPWRGPVLNGSGVEDMITTFALGADGRLVGRYHIEDAVPFDGTLSNFRETGPCAGDFRWHDLDGSGTVHIQFQPEQGRFLGRWRTDQPGGDMSSTATETGRRPSAETCPRRPLGALQAFQRSSREGLRPDHQMAKARKLPRPVTSRTTPLPCSSRSNAVPVCGATLSRAASALGVSAGTRSSASSASGSRERLSPPATTPLPCSAAASNRSSSRSAIRALSATRCRKASGQVTGRPRPATRSAASLRRPGSASRGGKPDGRIGGPDRHEDGARRSLAAAPADGGEQRMQRVGTIGEAGLHPALGGARHSEQRRQFFPASPPLPCCRSAAGPAALARARSTRRRGAPDRDRPPPMAPVRRRRRPAWRTGRRRAGRAAGGAGGPG